MMIIMMMTRPSRSESPVSLWIRSPCCSLGSLAKHIGLQLVGVINECCGAVGSDSDPEGTKFLHFYDLMDLLKEIDSYADPVKESESKNPLGGFLTLIFYPLAAAWIIWYIVGCVVTGQNLTINSYVDDFTEDPQNSVTLPPMTCISAGGCWVHPMAVPDPDTGQYPAFSCYFLRQGEDFPPFLRRIYLTPDPVQSLSVVFNNSQSFFSISYDQVRVVDYRIGTTIVHERNRTPGAPGSPQIYQGASLMQLTRTIRSPYYSQDSWASVSRCLCTTKQYLLGMCPSLCLK